MALRGFSRENCSGMRAVRAGGMLDENGLHARGIVDGKDRGEREMIRGRLTLEAEVCVIKCTRWLAKYI